MISPEFSKVELHYIRQSMLDGQISNAILIMSSRLQRKLLEKRRQKALLKHVTYRQEFCHLSASLRDNVTFQ